MQSLKCGQSLAKPIVWEMMPIAESDRCGERGLAPIWKPGGMRGEWNEVCKRVGVAILSGGELVKEWLSALRDPSCLAEASGALCWKDGF
jgi:hypothetical protein